MTAPDSASDFVLLVPVKTTADAKTRLGLAADRRLRLRHAFAQDAIAAARHCRRVEVHVVGDGAGLDAPVVPDEGGGDLNEALRRAAARVARPDVGTAVLLADLPCLVPDDLAAALRAAKEVGGRCFVPDAEGTGTTLLLAAPGTELDPHFGADSARRHLASGARRLELPLPSLRRDVDTLGDLEAAQALGVGPHTAAALEDAERR